MVQKVVIGEEKEGLLEKIDTKQNKLVVEECENVGKQKDQQIDPNHYQQYFNNGGMQLIQSPNEFEENMLMDDLDIDDILESEDIEQTAFISSSK